MLGGRKQDPCRRRQRESLHFVHLGGFVDNAGDRAGLAWGGIVGRWNETGGGRQQRLHLHFGRSRSELTARAGRQAFRR